MKQLVLCLVLLFITSPCMSAEQQPVIKDKMDEYNYSLGHQLGRKIIAHQLEFRPEALWQGVWDAVNDGVPYLSEEAMAEALKQLEDKASKAQQQAAVTPEAVAAGGKKDDPAQRQRQYRQRGEKFIAENTAKEGVVSLSSGVQYRVIKPGEGQQPKVTDSVMVNYTATDIDGKVFNSSSVMGAQVPVEFKISKLLPGLIEVLPMMKVGAVWEIYLPTRMAYKDTGPMAGQTVIYEMELLEILPEFY